MGRARESFGKKAQEKAKLQKKKDKEQRKEERKAGSSKGKGFDDMIAWVDEFGNILSEPPDPSAKQEIKVEDIQISVARMEDLPEELSIQRGVVSFINQAKGFGFITDHQSGESIFVHIRDMIDRIGEGDAVTYETTRGPKGLSAVRVSLYVAPPKS